MNIFNHYWWKDLWYTQISSRICPRQRWLTKKIPRTWIDKDYLIELVIFESIIHYVEKEKCFEVLNFEPDNDGPNGQYHFLKEVEAMYGFITLKLPQMEKELEDAWKRVPDFNLNDINSRKEGDYEKIYGEVNQIEKEIKDLKTLILEWSVREREKIWT